MFDPDQHPKCSTKRIHKKKCVGLKMNQIIKGLIIGIGLAVAIRIAMKLHKKMHHLIGIE
jgi:hypothetical protein